MLFPTAHLFSPVNQVSTEAPPNPMASSASQTTGCYLWVAIPVVEELALSELVVALAAVDPTATMVEAATTKTERNPPLNPKETPMVILEKEV